MSRDSIPTEYSAQCLRQGSRERWFFDLDAGHLDSDDLGSYVEVGPYAHPAAAGVLTAFRRGVDGVEVDIRRPSIFALRRRRRVRLDRSERIRRFVDPADTRGSIIRFGPIEDDDPGFLRRLADRSDFDPYGLER